jgi:hypothetical protein
MAQIYPRALGSLSVASYDSQGYVEEPRIYLFLVHLGKLPETHNICHEMIGLWQIQIRKPLTWTVVVQVKAHFLGYSEKSYMKPET